MPTIKQFAVRAINSKLGAVVETARPNCRLGYVAQSVGGTWGVVPAVLVGLFAPPPKLATEPALGVTGVAAQTWGSTQDSTATAYNRYGDVKCPQCYATHIDAVGSGPVEITCGCGNRFTARPYNA